MTFLKDLYPKKNAISYTRGLTLESDKVIMFRLLWSVACLYDTSTYFKPPALQWRSQQLITCWFKDAKQVI